MTQINFIHLGGMPLTQEVLDNMQEAYRDPLGALATLCGPYTILSGVVVNAGNVSAGWVSINGALLPFEAGPATALVDIVTTTEDLLYEDGQTKEVYTRRVAKCVNVGGTAFSSFKRLDTLATLMDKVVPAGLISMWAGMVPPAGWALCDGTNGTPNLKGRFIVGYDLTDPDYDAIGDTGGSKTHTLTVLEMPPHTHTMTNSNSDRGSGKAATGGDAQEGGLLQTNATGGGDPHENRPPYYTLAYIIKL